MFAPRWFSIRWWTARWWPPGVGEVVLCVRHLELWSPGREAGVVYVGGGPLAASVAGAAAGGVVVAGLDRGVASAAGLVAGEVGCR